MTLVQAVEFTGPFFRLHLHLPISNGGGLPVKMTAYMPRERRRGGAIEAGQHLPVHLPAHALHLYARPHVAEPAALPPGGELEGLVLP